MANAQNEKAHPSQLEKVKAIIDRLEAGIKNLFESEAFKKYLNTLSKFHHYSVNNTILIAMQKPDATLVAGYTSWQHDFGRQVKKGEQGIRILAPAPYKMHIERDKIDPATKLPVRSADGSIIRETEEITIPAFKVVNVFDVSQTEGKELPTIGVDELTGDVAQYDAFLESLKRTCPVPIGFEQIASGAKGYFHPAEQRIALQESMSQVQTIKTLIHEMAHQKLHSGEPKLARNVKEVEAEAVAYTVSQHFGIETSNYSFAYIAGWSAGKDTTELKASLDRIRAAADEMITDIEENLRAVQKERAEVSTERPEKAEKRPAGTRKMRERVSVLKTLKETKIEGKRKPPVRRREEPERI